MNSCGYSLDVLNQAPPYAAELGIACAEEGDVIPFSVYSSSSYEFRICKVALPALAARWEAPHPGRRVGQRAAKVDRSPG